MVRSRSSSEGSVSAAATAAAQPPPVSSSPPSAVGPSRDPEFDTIPFPTQRPAAHPLPGPVATVPFTFPPGWLDAEKLEKVPKAHYPAELPRLLEPVLPHCPPDEAVFRYFISQAVVSGDIDIPPLPGSTAKVLELSRNPKVGAADYAKVVEVDPVLAKEVLALANSSYFGAQIKCSSLAQAMVRIGIREVERTALMQAFKAKMFRVHGHNEMVLQLSRHGLAAALAAQSLARLLQTSAEDAYLGGLFHDIGKLALLGIVAKVQRSLMKTAPKSLLLETFDVFHIPMGVLGCRKWELPEPVIRATANHHNPAAAVREKLDQAVYLGNQIAHHWVWRDSPPQIVPPEDPVRSASGLTEEALQEVRQKTTQEMQVYLKMLG